MTNNDILRRLRFCFAFGDQQMIDTFALAEVEADRERVSAWLKKPDAEGFIELSDCELAEFLNGFIALKRGKKDGPMPPVEQRLNHNQVLRKLKIALNFKDDEMLAIFALAKFRLGKSELSAFFRKPGHKNYRACKDQVLRNFLMGLQLKYRPETAQSKPGFDWSSRSTNK